MLDALLQDERAGGRLERLVIEPLAGGARRAAQETPRAGRAATRVEFFTMVRGEE